ncbi:MAG: hypothetical protein IPK60_18435 [Sandaracinaceae bacterium]|nr:hypothetical protein [Sandaracinaceae bacterium]
MRTRLVADTSAVRKQLETWAALPLRKVIVSHGNPIDREPSRALRLLARSLNG